MPRSLPACSAPCWTTSQNASPAEPWVMTAKLRSPLPPPLLPLVLSPSDELSVVHAAARKSGTAMASASSRLDPAIEVLLCSRTQPSVHCVVAAGFCLARRPNVAGPALAPPDGRQPGAIYARPRGD